MYRVDNMLTYDVEKLYYNVSNLRERLEKLFDGVCIEKAKEDNDD